MCYHTSLNVGQNVLENRYKAKVEPGQRWNPVIHSNAFNAPVWPIVAAQEPQMLALLGWGMVPGWVKSAGEAEKLWTMTANCRYETMYQKPSFRAAASDGKRCLIPVSGFFEWHALGNKKYPFYIHPDEKSEGIVSIAGLWDEWADPETGEIRLTYTMLTRPANEIMARIHNSKERMPCLLRAELEREYLRESLRASQVTELLSLPYASRKLLAYPISRRITSRSEPTDTPEILNPHSYPELVGFEP